MLYFAWQFLVARAGACVSSESDPICGSCAARGVCREQRHELRALPTQLPFAFVVAQFETPCLLLDHQYSDNQVECAGDMLEAVGGILHPWRPEARLARDHLGGPNLVEADFLKARDLLGKLAQRCQWLVQYACPEECNPLTALREMLGDERSMRVVGLGRCPTCELEAMLARERPLAADEEETRGDCPWRRAGAGPATAPSARGQDRCVHGQGSHKLAPSMSGAAARPNIQPTAMPVSHEQTAVADAALHPNEQEERGREIVRCWTSSATSQVVRSSGGQASWDARSWGDPSATAQWWGGMQWTRYSWDQEWWRDPPLSKGWRASTGGAADVVSWGGGHRSWDARSWCEQPAGARLPPSISDRDRRFPRDVFGTITCDFCLVRVARGRCSMDFDGSFWNKHWDDSLSQRALRKAWERGEIDARFGCTRCLCKLRRDSDLEETRRALGILTLLA